MKEKTLRNISNPSYPPPQVFSPEYPQAVPPNQVNTVTAGIQIPPTNSPSANPNIFVNPKFQKK